MATLLYVGLVTCSALRPIGCERDTKKNIPHVLLQTTWKSVEAGPRSLPYDLWIMHTSLIFKYFYLNSESMYYIQYLYQ